MGFLAPKPSRHLCEGTACSASGLGGGRRTPRHAPLRGSPAPISGAFFMEQFRGFSPCPLRVMDKLPGSPGARRARAVVEHTRKPGGLPRPERRGHLRAGTSAQPRVSGAVRSLNGTLQGASLKLRPPKSSPPPRRAQNGTKRPKSLSTPKPLFLSANPC